jgi:hypothetical protein
MTPCPDPDYKAYGGGEPCRARPVEPGGRAGVRRPFTEA